MSSESREGSVDITQPAGSASRLVSIALLAGRREAGLRLRMRMRGLLADTLSERNKQEIDWMTHAAFEFTGCRAGGCRFPL